MSFRELELRKDPDCPLCGDHPTIRELVDYEAFCGLEPEAEEASGDEIGARELDVRCACRILISRSSTCASRTNGRSRGSRARV